MKRRERIPGRINHGTLEIKYRPIWQLRAERKLAALDHKPGIGEILKAAAGDVDYGRELMIRFGYAVEIKEPLGDVFVGLETVGKVGGRLGPRVSAAVEERLRRELAPETLGSSSEAVELRRITDAFAAGREASNVARRRYFRDVVVPMARKLAAKMRKERSCS